MQAAFSISRDDAAAVLAELRAGCPVGEHWRCKRALRDAEKMMVGEIAPRLFYW